MENLVKELKKSPLFAMSLGSMELFHSNFWRWLMEQNKKYISIFFNDFENIDSKDIQIAREYKHTYICIKYKNNYYIIENKIKSMLSEEQLQEYTESFTSKKETFVKGVYIFPLDINFLNNKLCNWSFMNYSKILSKITIITEEIKKEKDPSLNDSIIAIIDEYVRMTKNLICLMKHAIIHYDNTFICEEDEIFEYLKELRIYDIVRKINCELLKKKLEEKLKVAFPSSFNQINIISGFSHGHSSLSARWKIPFTDDEKDGYFLIGPQIENNQFRTMIHICCNYFGISNSKTITDKQRKAIYEAVKEEVFSLGEDYYLTNNV